MNLKSLSNSGMPEKLSVIERVEKLIPPPMKPFMVRAWTEVRKLEIGFRSRNACAHPSPVFVLGNQKSGTSVVAALLGESTSLSVSVDLVKEYLSTGRTYVKVRRGEINFSQLIRRNGLDFSRAIIKEANLTVFYAELKAHFPESQCVFVVRDPRDNIRSLLNRLDIPGDAPYLDKGHLKKVPRGWYIVIDGGWLGLQGNNYIEMLAARWNLLADVYLKNRKEMELIRYEDFLEDKADSIYWLAKRLGLAPTNDISDKVDTQYQPRGNREVNWDAFFGDENLQRIERICGDRMRFFGYPVNQSRP
jgi:hypothetical protein